MEEAKQDQDKQDIKNTKGVGELPEGKPEYVGPTISFRNFLKPGDLNIPEQHNPMLENLMKVNIPWYRRLTMYIERKWKKYHSDKKV